MFIGFDCKFGSNFGQKNINQTYCVSSNRLAHFYSEVCLLDFQQRAIKNVSGTAAFSLLEFTLRSLISAFFKTKTRVSVFKRRECLVSGL